MAAAYAAVVSLLNAVGRIKNHFSNHEFRKDLGDSYSKFPDDLEEMGRFLKEFLETYSHGYSEYGRDLETQIANFASQAEDAIENCVADRLNHGRLVTNSPYRESLDKVKGFMQFIKQRVMKIQGLRNSKDQQLPKYSMSLAGSSTGLERAKYPMSLSSSSNAPAITCRDSAMVGFEDELLEIMERLTGGDSSRQVIPIVGMGGIGKTKLARSIYQNRLIVHHFDIQIWITISQDYTLRGLLLQIPVCKKEQDKIERLLANDQLGLVLYKFLFGRRYLIILDDMWDIDVWNNIKLFFPNDDTSVGRIIVTTRISNAAAPFGSPVIKMRFLDEDNSWNLFCKTVFGQNDCPLELKNIGKDISHKCKGLPLSIITIGGVLMKSSRIKEYWESVANDINSFLNSGDGERHCQNVLLLSYDHLPLHLKPCFLYMGILPENQEIYVSQLLKLWIAEGFIKRDNIPKSWEEIAEDCLKDLVNRNFIIIRRWGLNGKMETCYIHSLLRDLCLGIADKEEFICVLRNRVIPQGLHQKRRIVFHGKHLSQDFCDIPHPLTSRTLMCGGGVLPLLENRTLCILDAVNMNSFEDVLQHVNLRYIRCRLTSMCRIPPSISQLWNLQTIICNNISLVIAPFEIWTLKQVRHFEFSEISLPYPHLEGLQAWELENLNKWESQNLQEGLLAWESQNLQEGKLQNLHERLQAWKSKYLQGRGSQNLETLAWKLRNLAKWWPQNLQDGLQAKELRNYILQKRHPHLFGYAWHNLQTAMKLVNFKCTREVLVIFPYIKKLKIKYEAIQGEDIKTGEDFCLGNFNQFIKIESFKVYFYVKKCLRMDLQRCLTYPSSLKELTLDNIELFWDDLVKFGSLPNLEDLKLKGSITGSTWNPIEGGFRSLKSLRIVAFIDLQYWNANESHFPVLEILDLGGVPRLEEIPPDFADILTLKVIKFCSSRAPTALSAMKILVEQESYGNEGLQVRVTFMNAMEERSFQAIVESENLESNNFIIETGI